MKTIIEYISESTVEKITIAKLKKYLKQNNIPEVDVDGPFVPNSYSIYKKTLYVCIGNDLSFNFEFSNKPGYEPSISNADGSSLITSNESMFELLHKYFDGEMSEQEIIDLVD